jgi:TRAP transporter TAXI family solute receptor
VALAAATLVGCGGEGGPRVEFLSLGTAGTGGIYYPIGGALASRLSLRDSLRQYTAEVTGGSVENVNRIRSGEIDLAFSLAVTMWGAFRGSEEYPEPVAGLRVLAPLYPNMIHVMVAPGADVTSVTDLAGKRVATGPPGSGTEQISRQLLAAHGLTYDDIDERFLSFAEASSALKDRAIDAALISVGFPASSILDATTTGGIQLIPIDPQVVAAVVEEYPYYMVGEIPAGAYPGVETSISTLAMMNWVIGDEALPDEVVEHLLEILANERADLEQVHPQAGQIDLGALDVAPIPLHPATAAWREAR